MLQNRFKWETSGKAKDENIVVCGNARFTILTERLIRVEYDSLCQFVDSASQVVFHRDFPVTSYQTYNEDGCLNIETEYLILKYTIGEKFRSDSLSIQVKKAPMALWRYGEGVVPQLKGTAITLDGANGAIPLQDGLCSRYGYTVVDDSDSVLLTEEGWFEVRENDEVDTYFFGYGRAYLDCIADYYRLTGIPPLLPDYALGNWWSRYHKYTQQEYCELIEKFEKKDIPFSVAVIDMDWHTTADVTEESYMDHPRFWAGWTGYTWNKQYFPDYKEFLKFLKEHGLKTSLNLHPANGVGCHEEMYPQMAEACGVDPNTKKLIKLDMLNPDFMEKYFDILHHPYEEDGVDFWWMDWQQGTDYWWIHDDEHPASALEKISPLWLLNHLHISDIMHSGKRPMFFSRYSGLGSNRYPVGFSGDAHITWDSLDFQPYFTANASNVGYTWWSHDIGGHLEGYRDDELQIRWLQLGVLSPINRLHSGDNPFLGKEPWNLGKMAEMVAEDWLRKRHQLFPYLYTMNYRNHHDLKPMIQPMYYSHPECEEAYEYPKQYWLGSEVIVSPITEKNDSLSLLGATEVWLPEGKWIDFFNGVVYNGGRTINAHRSLEQNAIFAKAGAIVPIADYEHDNALGAKENMSVYVFPGADNQFELYEDAGDGYEYEEGAFATTRFALKWGEEATFTIEGPQCTANFLPKVRKWTVVLRGFSENVRVKVFVDGKEQKVTCEYDEMSATLKVQMDKIATNQMIKLVMSSETTLMTTNDFVIKRIFDILLHAQVAHKFKDIIWELATSKKEKRQRLTYFYPDALYKPLLNAVTELETALKPR